MFVVVDTACCAWFPFWGSWVWEEGAMVSGAGSQTKQLPSPPPSLLCVCVLCVVCCVCVSSTPCSPYLPTTVPFSPASLPIRCVSSSSLQRTSRFSMTMASVAGEAVGQRLTLKRVLLGMFCVCLCYRPSLCVSLCVSFCVSVYDW